MFIKIPNKFKIKNRKLNLDKEKLISFENEIAKDYNNAKIKGPIHLSKGNEKQLLKIFKYIDKKDPNFIPINYGTERKKKIINIRIKQNHLPK